jgi:hypothetical protein
VSHATILLSKLAVGLVQRTLDIGKIDARTIRSRHYF